MLNQCWLSRAASNWKDDAIKIITVLWRGKAKDILKGCLINKQWGEKKTIAVQFPARQGLGELGGKKRKETYRNGVASFSQNRRSWTTICSAEESGH